MPDDIKVTLCGEIATVVLNRPRRFNAFDLDAVSALAEHLIGIAADDTIHAVIITGQGKAFSAGGDVLWAADWPEGAASAFHHLAARYHQAVLEIKRMPKPVIAAVNGMAAAGGLSLALACDFRIMERSAVMRLAYTSNGLCVDGGGTYTLPRLVGLARAMEICAFDPPINSERALSWGLVTKVVEDGQSVERAAAFAGELLTRSLNSFRHFKQLLADSFGDSFERQIEKERAALRSCAAHPDGAEGIQAFIDKRKPVFNR